MHIQGTDQHYIVAVQFLPVFIHSDTAVGITIISYPQISMILSYGSFNSSV